jgi:hypothetical protein
MPKIFIKNSKSLSAISNEEMDAEVVVENCKVYLKKRDPNGYRYKSLIGLRFLYSDGGKAFERFSLMSRTATRRIDSGSPPYVITYPARSLF